MNKRIERLDRIKAVEHEFESARTAIERVERLLHAQPEQAAVMKMGLADLRKTAKNLQATYFIRLFAEFESGLRDFWKNGRRRQSKPATEQLIDSLAAVQAVPQDCVDGVQTVRKYRNTLVHDDAEDVTEVSIESGRKYLCWYFSCLPLTW